MSSSDSSRKKAKKKAPSPRRDGREAAVQYLFSSDLRGEIDFSQGALDEFWELRQAKSFAREFQEQRGNTAFVHAERLWQGKCGEGPCLPS